QASTGRQSRHPKRDYITTAARNANHRSSPHKVVQKPICTCSLPPSSLHFVCEGRELVGGDKFGRRINEHGLNFVDWEGQIANPAIKFFVAPPQDAAFPAQAVLTSLEPRVYFNVPSEIGARGPRKVIDFRKWDKLPVLVSIFPNRTTDDQDLVLELRFQDAH